jgi:ABC-type polysaccharide/polyol phosphate export permease
VPTLRLLLRYRTYVWRRALSDVRYRYAGTGIGVFWNVINPLLQVLVYGVVFVTLFDWRGGGDRHYGLYLCAGILPWAAFSESVVRGAHSLVRNAPYLRSLPVPEPAFVAESAVASTLALGLTLTLVLLLALAFGRPASWSLAILPLAAILLQAFAFGLSLALASLRVLFPDVSEILRIVMQLWMWTLPVVYPESLVPSRIARLLDWNPPYVFIRTIRAILLGTSTPSPSTVAAMLAWSVAAIAFGATVSRRLRFDVRDAI